MISQNISMVQPLPVDNSPSLVAEYSQEIRQMAQPRRMPVDDCIDCIHTIRRGEKLLKIRDDLKERLGQLPSDEVWADEACLSVGELQKYLEDMLKAEHQMIQSHLRLVWSLARKLHKRYASYKRYAPYLDVMDLNQEGIFGLRKAVKKFDPTRNCEFHTYASFSIRNAIIDTIKKNTRCGNQKVRPPLALEHSNDEGVTLEESIEDPKAQLELERIENRIYLEQLITTAQLSTEEQKFINLWFDLESGQKLSQEEVAQELGWKRHKVAQIENKARRKLKKLAKEKMVATASP